MNLSSHLKLIMKKNYVLYLFLILFVIPYLILFPDNQENFAGKKSIIPFKTGNEEEIYELDQNITQQNEELSDPDEPIINPTFHSLFSIGILILNSFINSSLSISNIPFTFSTLKVFDIFVLIINFELGIYILFHLIH